MKTLEEIKQYVLNEIAASNAAERAYRFACAYEALCRTETDAKRILSDIAYNEAMVKDILAKIKDKETE